MTQYQKSTIEPFELTNPDNHTSFCVVGKLKNIIKTYYTTKKGHRGTQIIFVLQDCIVNGWGDGNAAKHIAIEVPLKIYSKNSNFDNISKQQPIFDCELESVEYNGKWFTKAVCVGIEYRS